MANGPNDRPVADTSDAEPRLFTIVNGKRFPRPSLETFFAPAAGAPEEDPEATATNRIGVVTVCTCDKVCRCQAVPANVVKNEIEQIARTVAAAHADRSPSSADSSRVSSGCSCVSVCSCDSHRSCSCVSTCSCDSHRSSYGGGTIVTGCRCAPVH